MDKASIRSEFLAIREQIPDRDVKNEEIFLSFKIFLENIDVSSILLYLSNSSEVDTWHLFDYLTSIKKYRLFLPHVDEIEIGEVQSRADLVEVTKHSKIFHIPKERTRRVIPDLAIIPAVAFDKFGNRIGYGKGWYDRYLSTAVGIKYKVGFAYEEQIYDGKLPCDEHDQKVNFLFSDRGFKKLHI